MSLDDKPDMSLDWAKEEDRRALIGFARKALSQVDVAWDGGAPITLTRDQVMRLCGAFYLVGWKYAAEYAAGD